jgi:hypothetical protein
MNVVPVYMDRRPEHREVQPCESRREVEPQDESPSSFWHWFAVGVLLFCWIAEASMCADRGF